MKQLLTVIATYEENTTDKNNSDFQQYAEAIAKDYTAAWDSCEVTVEVDGETYKAKQVGNRHEDDEEFVSELKGHPWHKASEGLPPHEGYVAVAMKEGEDDFRMQIAYFCIGGNRRWFKSTKESIVAPSDDWVDIEVPEDLYWRYIGFPNF